MLSNVDAPEQFPCQIARGNRAEEIGDHQSNRARGPKSHGLMSSFLQPLSYRRIRLTAMVHKRHLTPR